MLYTALAVTNEHFLVVAFIAEGLPGLLRFDLVGGGEPERFSLDPVFVNPVADLVSDGCSGLWLLDAVTRRIYRLDRNLQPYPAAPVAEETDLFQPDAPLPARQHVVAPDRLEILFPAARIPLQMAAGEGEELFVLTARAAGGSAVVYVLDPGETDLRKIGDDSRDWAMFAYSATGAVATDKGQTLVFVPATGNQAFAFAITRNGGGTVDGLSERPGCCRCGALAGTGCWCAVRILFMTAARVLGTGFRSCAKGGGNLRLAMHSRPPVSIVACRNVCGTASALTRASRPEQRCASGQLNCR